MTTPTDLQQSLDTLATFHPLLDILVWTFWLWLSYKIWQRLLAAVFGTNKQQVSASERVRLRAYEEQIEAGLLVPMHAKPVEKTR